MSTGQKVLNCISILAIVILAALSITAWKRDEEHKETIERSQDQIAFLEKRQGEDERAIETLEVSNTKLQTRVTDLEATVVDLEATVVDLEATVVDLEATVVDLEATVLKQANAPVRLSKIEKNDTVIVAAEQAVVGRNLQWEGSDFTNPSSNFINIVWNRSGEEKITAPEGAVIYTVWNWENLEGLLLQVEGTKRIIIKDYGSTQVSMRD